MFVRQLTDSTAAGYITAPFQDLSISTLPLPDRDAILDHTALKWALDRPGVQCMFERFHKEIERQWGIYKQEKAHLFGNSPQTPIKIDADEQQQPSAAAEMIQVQENETSRGDKVTTSRQTPPSPSDWSPDVLEAFRKGDVDALKTALGNIDLQPPGDRPKTRQDQIDLEYPPRTKPYGPWGIPLPNLVIPEVDLYHNTKPVTEYLGGLNLAYDNKTHSVRVVLPANKRDSPPTDKVSEATVAKFTRATAKIWKWVEAMKEAREVIPLDEWVRTRMEAKKKDRKAALLDYIDRLDAKTLHRSVRKKSARSHSQKRTASAAAINEGDDHEADDAAATSANSGGSASRTSRSNKRRKHAGVVIL